MKRYTLKITWTDTRLTQTYKNILTFSTRRGHIKGWSTELQTKFTTSSNTGSQSHKNPDSLSERLGPPPSYCNVEDSTTSNGTVETGGDDD